MFSKILVKLIDQAIVPAILLLAVRIVSVVLIARYYNIPINLSATGFNIPTENFVMLNSLSVLVMIIVLTVGLFYILMKSFILHDSHITPPLTAKLFALRLASFIQSSFDLYSQGIIWLSYSYLLMLVSAAMVIFGILYPWIFLTSVVLTIFGTVFFVLDIENELENKGEKEVNVEEVVLNFGSFDE